MNNKYPIEKLRDLPKLLRESQPQKHHILAFYNNYSVSWCSVLVFFGWLVFIVNEIVSVHNVKNYVSATLFRLIKDTLYLLT